jgi:MFS family permease
MNRTAAEPATFRSVLAEPRFRALFVARTLSLTAGSLRSLALSILVFELTGSPVLSALAFGIGFLPQALGVTLLGALADLAPPRRLVVVGYLVESVVAAVLAVRGLSVAAALLIIATAGLFAPLFSGASGRMVAEFLTGDAYVLGRSLMSMAQSSAQLAGLAVGAVAVAALGPRPALVVTAVCQLAAAVIAWTLLPTFAGRRRRSDGTSAVRQSWNGNRELWRDGAVRTLVLAQWLPPAFVAGAEGLLVPYAAAAGQGPVAPALLLSCVPVGMLVGEYAVARLLTPTRRERFVVALVLVTGLPLVAFVAHPGLVVAGFLLALSGTGFAYGLGVQRQFLVAVGPDRRGQAFALLAAGLMTLQGLGPAVFGLVGEFVPLGYAISLAGVATVGTAVVLHFALPGRATTRR